MAHLINREPQNISIHSRDAAELVILAILANAVVDFVIAILYKGSKAPVTSDATMSATAKASFVSP